MHHYYFQCIIFSFGAHGQVLQPVAAKLAEAIAEEAARPVDVVAAAADRDPRAPMLLQLSRGGGAGVRLQLKVPVSVMCKCYIYWVSCLGLAALPAAASGGRRPAAHVA